MAEEQHFGGERAIGFELADPVTVGGLMGDEIVLSASYRIVESRHDRKW